MDKSDRPLEPVLISRCGELERRKKKAPAPAQNLISESRDRGRRRSGSDVEMSNSPEPGLPHKHRRQSDNLMDEGIRGRPRQRSGSRSRSPTRPHSSHEETEDSERGSPAKKHKRKRSPSPSRHVDTGSTERRRRSLPNQYRDRRTDRTDPDDDRYKPSPRRDDYRHVSRKWEDGGHSRKDNRYRPSRDRNPYGDDGRLGGGSHDDYDPPVKFKGRGVMKYREAERQW